MKITYGIKVNGTEVTEVCQLKDIERVTKQLSTRRTGKTTRMFFRALGSDSKEIIITGKNNNHARQLAKRLFSILGILDIPHEILGALEVVIYDKNIKILPEESYQSMFLYDDCEVFRDEY